MNQFYLKKVIAKPFAWSSQLPKTGEYIKTYDDMYLRISDFRRTIGNYFACKTSRGTYFVDCTDIIGHESVLEKDAYIGIIRVKPRPGETGAPNGAPLEYINHENNNEIDLLYDAPGMVTMNKIENVMGIWENFYCITIGYAKFYVIEIE